MMLDTCLVIAVNPDTRSKMPVRDLSQFRIDGRTLTNRDRAPRAKMAARWRIDRCWDITLQHNSLPFLPRVWYRYCRQKSLSIWVQRARIQLAGVTKFYYLTQIHNSYPVRNMLNYSQTVRNKKIGQSELIL